MDHFRLAVPVAASFIGLLGCGSPAAPTAPPRPAPAASAPPPTILLPPVAGAAGLEIPADKALTAVDGVDLGVSDDETYRRPNSWSQLESPKLPTERLLLSDADGPASRPGMSIAWRNAAQIEEVEVRVRNLGKEPGVGKVFVDVLDEAGRTLLHLEPPDDQKEIRFPAFDRGGKEGKVVRMKASRELNNLIDRYDRERRRYDVRATVDTVGVDARPFDNMKAKSWNVSFGVRPGYTNVYNYVFRNVTSQPVTVKWLFEHTPYPQGWDVQGVPASDKPMTLAPDQEIRGTLLMRAPDQIAEGAFVEARLSLVKADSGNIFQQHEWFQVYDTVPPQVSNYRIVMTQDHRVAIQALVADRGSAVLEATGVTTEYSTDGGRTWSMRAHNYNNGNFVNPTLFEAVLGPFAKGTQLQLRLTAKDTAGNVQSVIPNDATALLAPPNAEKLIDMAYIFPRAQANPIFELKAGKADLVAMTQGLTLDDTAPNARAARDALMRALPKNVAVAEAPLKRLDSPGQEILKMSTLGLEVP